MITQPSVPMKVRHLSPGIFRLEGAEGSSHSCPCSRSRLIQQVAPSRSVCADRRLYRRHPLRHPNSPIARGVVNIGALFASRVWWPLAPATLVDASAKAQAAGGLAAREADRLD